MSLTSCLINPASHIHPLCLHHLFSYVCPRERREAPLLFEACIALLGSCFSKLHAELDRQMGEHYATVNSSLGDGFHSEPEYDMTLGVRLAEAAAQAMWGSANSCSTSGISPMPFNMAHVQQLAEMGRDCLETEALPLSRVCHCITATLATLASGAETAELLMACPGDLALTTLLRLSVVQESDNFSQAGNVKASACAAVAFLSCHPVGAKGDECMVGPYRTKLLEAGAFGVLLRASIVTCLDEFCDIVVQQVTCSG